MEYDRRQKNIKKYFRIEGSLLLVVLYSRLVGPLWVFVSVNKQLGVVRHRQMNVFGQIANVDETQTVCRKVDYFFVGTAKPIFYNYTEYGAYKRWKSLNC